MYHLFIHTKGHQQLLWRSWSGSVVTWHASTLSHMSYSWMEKEMPFLIKLFMVCPMSILTLTCQNCCVDFCTLYVLLTLPLPKNWCNYYFALIILHRRYQTLSFFFYTLPFPSRQWYRYSFQLFIYVLSSESLRRCSLMYWNVLLTYFSELLEQIVSELTLWPLILLKLKPSSVSYVKVELASN